MKLSELGLNGRETAMVTKKLGVKLSTDASKIKKDLQKIVRKEESARQVDIAQHILDLISGKIVRGADAPKKSKAKKDTAKKTSKKKVEKTSKKKVKKKAGKTSGKKKIKIRRSK